MLGVATATIFAYVTVLDALANQAENAPSAPPSPLNSTLKRFHWKICMSMLS